MKRITVRDLADFKQSKKRFTMLTSYDSLTASLFDEAGIPVLLVGDSAANLVFGYDSTLPVTVQDMLPIVSAVARSSKNAMVVADMPFGSYQTSTSSALESATTIAFFVDLVTAETMGSMSSTVTGSVESYPKTRFAAESPTKRTGIPASSKREAVKES